MNKWWIIVVYWWTDAYETAHRRAQLPVPSLLQSLRTQRRPPQTSQLLPRRHETVPVPRLPAILQGTLSAAPAYPHRREAVPLRNVRSLLRSKVPSLSVSSRHFQMKMWQKSGTFESWLRIEDSKKKTEDSVWFWWDLKCNGCDFAS